MRFFKVTGLLLLVASAAVFRPSIAKAEVYFKETESRYDLGTGLRSKRDIWASVIKYAPKHDGRTAIGTAQGKPRFTYRYERNNGRCSVTDVQMQMHVDLTLPRWDGIHSAKPELQAYYRCIKKTVVVHEREHSRIWYETAKRADKKLKSVLRDVPCDQFKSLAGKHFRKAIDRGKERQRAFDKVDYARRRYQRCHAITRENMTQAVRYTAAQYPWEPPVGRSAPRWNRPAIERTPRRTAVQRPQAIRTAKRSPNSEEADTRDRSSTESEVGDISLTAVITLLALCVMGGLAWFGIAKPYLAAEFNEDDTKGSWADKVILPDANRAPTNTPQRGPPTQAPVSGKPTFGKRGL